MGLESKIVASVGNALAKNSADVAEKLLAFEKRLAASSRQLDKLEADINTRLTKIEVLFAMEINAKEKARDIAVKKKRLKK